MRTQHEWPMTMLCFFRQWVTIFWWLANALSHCSTSQGKASCFLVLLLDVSASSSRDGGWKENFINLPLPRHSSLSVHLSGPLICSNTSRWESSFHCPCSRTPLASLQCRTPQLVPTIFSVLGRSTPTPPLEIMYVGLPDDRIFIRNPRQPFSPCFESWQSLPSFLLRWEQTLLPVKQINRENWNQVRLSRNLLFPNGAKLVRTQLPGPCTTVTNATSCSPPPFFYPCNHLHPLSSALLCLLPHCPLLTLRHCSYFCSLASVTWW